MKNKALALFFVLCSLYFISNSHADIKEFCADKWPNDYKMRDYCQNQQIEANNKLFDIAAQKGLIKNGTLSTSSNGGDYEKIVNRCLNKWEKNRFQTYDFTMVVYCIDQQFEAYEKTTNSGSDNSLTGIKGYCANKWPNDYSMRDYCENQQIEAKHQLFDIAEQYGLVSDGSLSASPNGNKVEKTINRCMRKWEEPRFKTYDYTMVVYCINQQLN